MGLDYEYSKIEAMVWCPKTPDFDRWEIINLHKSTTLKISGELSEIEIGSVVQKICGQLNFDKRFSLEDLIKKSIQTNLEDFAYIRFVGEKGIETSNGCCSDFIDWKKLKNVKTESIWFGHDPTPVFHYNEADDSVLVWIDGNNVGSNKEQYSIQFTWREFKENLKRLETDLNDFLVLLEIWSEKRFPDLADSFVEKIKENLGIKEKDL